MIKLGNNQLESNDYNYLTGHGKQRITERIGRRLPKTPEQQASLAWRFGLSQENLSGGLFRWVDRRRIKFPGKIQLIYKKYLFVFSKEAPHKVITVYPVPNKFHGDCNRLEKKKRKNNL